MKVLGVELPLDSALAPLVQLGAKIGTKLTIDAVEKKLGLRSASLYVVEMYPVVDTIVEDYVEGTPSALDDAAKNGTKQALEEWAKDHNIELPNLDED